MQQTIYTEIDEEITSILDKIRQEKGREIFLVIPKGAMFLNSILNLKLLKKETERMGKTVVIVAPNDKKARTIIERAGIKAEDYQSSIGSEQRNHTALDFNSSSNYNNDINQATSQSIQEVGQNLKVGSNAFFADLSSQKNYSDIDRHFNNKQVKTIKDKEYDYFHPSDKAEKSNKKKNYGNKKKSKKMKTFSIIMLTLFVLGAAGFGFYMVNYPKTFVEIYPMSKKINEEIKLSVRDTANEINIEDKVIPGEYLEISLEKKKTFKATGIKVLDKNGAKAQGVVTIKNYFSNKPQPLVKTTRVLSKSGKLFRLTKSVVVPGMKDGKPGVVEVAVQADKPGKDFNIGKEEFTIEGFKGGPKYEKFKVVGNGAMSGGVTSSSSKNVQVVSEMDLTRARKETIKELDEELISEIKKRIGENQTFVESTIEKEVASSNSSHLQDSITDTFSYTVVYKVKLIVIDKDDLKEISKRILREKIDPKYEFDINNFNITIKRGVADLEKKTMTIYVEIDGTAWFSLNEKEIKNKLLNKKLIELKDILGGKNGIAKAEIKNNPTWIHQTPKTAEKITIKIVKKK